VRELVGILVLQCALVAAGLGVLRLLGLAVPRGGRAWPAVGPAILVGTASVTVLLIALLVIDVSLTFAAAVAVAALLAALGFGLTWRRAAADESGGSVLGMVGLRRVALVIAGVYVASGAYALAHAPTRGDDARIWSLKGLALTYHGSLRPEIFLNPASVASHPVYPVFQPVLEAVLGRATGQPALRLIHAELWLLLIAAIWTVGYLIWWRCARPLREQVGIALLAMLAILPAVVSNVWSGYADATGAVLLATGAVSLGLWIDGREPGHLWLAAILLAAAANTKDEDMVGAILVLLAAGVVLAVRAEGRRLRLWLGATGLFAVLIAPWRIWTAAHHLSDTVVPPLPRALSPVFVLDRLPQLKQAASAMVTQTLSGWGWLAAIFIALCIISLATRTARRLAVFYLLSFVALVAALLWLYTTTPVSLAFLIPTSMARTVTVFMALTPVASAHLLTKLLFTGADAPVGTGAAREHTESSVLGWSQL
jgi:hypothetical protein